MNLVSYALWQQVYTWATARGYKFDNAGSGKATNQPVQTIDWYDAVKWCNARSKMDGVPIVYYSDANLTQVYTNGDVAPYVNLTDGRLPTANRGGMGKGGPRRIDEPAFSIRQYYFAKPGQLLRRPGKLHLRPGPGGLQPGLWQRYRCGYEPGRIFSSQWIRTLRHGREPIRVVLGLVWRVSLRCPGQPSRPHPRHLSDIARGFVAHQRL